MRTVRGRCSTGSQSHPHTRLFGALVYTMLNTDKMDKLRHVANMYVTMNCSSCNLACAEKKVYWQTSISFIEIVPQYYVFTMLSQILPDNPCTFSPSFVKFSSKIYKSMRRVLKVTGLKLANKVWQSIQIKVRYIRKYTLFFHVIAKPVWTFIVVWNKFFYSLVIPRAVHFF